MTLLRLWFAISGGVLGLAFVWAYVPIVIPLLVLVACLGVLTAGVVSAARWLERRRGADRE